jgi:hypothetical protein
MQKTATILPVTTDPSPLKVIPLLSPEEEKLIALIANIAVDHTLKQAYEKSDSLSSFQQ